MRSARAIAAGLVVASAGIAGCTSSEAVTDGRVEVVASFYPLAEAAERVGGSLVHVTNLTAPGAEPHDLELTPDQLEAIGRADLVLYLGGGFQPAVQDAVGDAPGDAIDVSQAIRSLAVPPGEGEPGLTADPHVWLDPSLYRTIVEQVRSALAHVDPAHGTAYAADAGAFGDRLRALDVGYRTGLATCERAVIVTSHAAFGYLARRYGLRQEPISGPSPESEPTPQRLADLKDLVERDGVTTIFTEELVSPKVAEALARETGVTTAVLDPLESLTPRDLADGEDYVSVMQRNLTTLRTALGCR